MELLGLGIFRLADSCTNTGVLPGLFKGLCTGGEVKITSVSDVVKIVANATQIAIAISGGLAIIFLLAAAVYYVISAGDPGKTKQAKEIIQNVVMGLIIIIMAYALVNLLAKGL